MASRGGGQETGPERAAEPERERERASVQRVHSQIEPDHRKLGERRVNDRPVEVVVGAEDVAE